MEESQDSSTIMYAVHLAAIHSEFTVYKHRGGGEGAVWGYGHDKYAVLPVTWNLVENATKARQSPFVIKCV